MMAAVRYCNVCTHFSCTRLASESLKYKLEGKVKKLLLVVVVTVYVCVRVLKPQLAYLVI